MIHEGDWIAVTTQSGLVRGRVLKVKPGQSMVSRGPAIVRVTLQTREGDVKDLTVSLENVEDIRESGN